MLPLLKAAFALLSLLELTSSMPLTTTSPLSLLPQKLKEITKLVHNLQSRVQVPCNDSRVAQVTFTDQKLSDQELLCQAAMALMKVTRCKTDYEPVIANLQSQHGKTNCSLSNDNEIYLRHFLPELGNFTQGMYRRLGVPPGQ
uniref:Interleukin-4 n=1 Tax=Aquila chrysaetos chrysaetos TaxID=223781 RepID=A0A663F5Y1_AQUCH